VSLFDRKLLIFTGKGGVGKTSVSIGLAFHAASQGRRILLAEVRTSRRIPTILSKKFETDGPVELVKGVDWINLTPAVALKTYALRLLKWKSIYQAVFEQRAVRRFLEAIPALLQALPFIFT